MTEYLLGISTGFIVSGIIIIVCFIFTDNKKGPKDWEKY